MISEAPNPFPTDLYSGLPRKAPTTGVNDNEQNDNKQNGEAHDEHYKDKTDVPAQEAEDEDSYEATHNKNEDEDEDDYDAAHHKNEDGYDAAQNKN